jgi:hypothetical protein
MTGGMLVQNTDWTRQFLIDFANYEHKLPSLIRGRWQLAYHGWDNGAIHMHLLRTLVPEAKEAIR